MNKNRFVPAAFAALLTLVPAARVHAQTSFGIIGGASIAKITDLDAEALGETESGLTPKTKSRFGFQGGLYLNKALGAVLSLQPEVQYVQKGVKFEVDLGAADGGLAKFGVKLGYLEVPVLLRADFAKTQAWHPFILAGPSFAFRTSCKVSLSFGEGDVTTNCDASDSELGTAEDPFNKFDFGGVVGAGLGGTLGGRMVALHVRYGHGFTNINKDNGDTSLSGVTNKNYGFSILLSIGK